MKTRDGDFIFNARRIAPRAWRGAYRVGVEYGWRSRAGHVTWRARRLTDARVCVAMRRETERAWIAERAKLCRDVERYRTSALKMARELERVKHLRETERDEARATRAALMESNRDAKSIEAEWMREMAKYENMARHERARREAAEAEKDELAEVLRVACETLDRADGDMRDMHRKIQDDMRTTVDLMDASRVSDLERTVSSVGATQTLLNRLSQIYDDAHARTLELRRVSAE